MYECAYTFHFYFRLSLAVVYRNAYKHASPCLELQYVIHNYPSVFMYHSQRVKIFDIMQLQLTWQ